MVNTTLSISLEKSRENEKLASFLQVLKDHPDQIISDAIKSEYIEFLEFALERAKDDNTWGGHVVPKLLQLGIVEKEMVKTKYLALLESYFEYVKEGMYWYSNDISELLKLGIIEEEKVMCLEFLEFAFEKVKEGNDDYVSVILELLKLGRVEKEEMKEKYLAFLEFAFERARENKYWASNVVLELLELGIIEEEKVMCLEFLEFAFERAEENKYWASNVVLELLKLGIVEKEEMKKKCLEFLEFAFEKVKEGSDDYIGVILKLLKLGIIEKKEMQEKYREFLEFSFEWAKEDKYWAEQIIPELVQLGIVGEEYDEKYFKIFKFAFERARTSELWNEISLPVVLLQAGILRNIDKEKYIELLNIAFEGAKDDDRWASNVIPELLKLGIIGKEDKEKYVELLNIAFERAKEDGNWAEYVVPELLQLGIGIIGKEYKEKYVEFLAFSFERAKEDSFWALNIVPELLKLGIVEEEEVQEQYLELLEVALEIAKENKHWASDVVPQLLKLGIVGVEAVKERYLELWRIAFERARTGGYWVEYVVPALLELGIVGEEYEGPYFKFFEFALERAKTVEYWANSGLPALLQAGIFGNMDKGKYCEFFKVLFEIAKGDSDLASNGVPEILAREMVYNNENGDFHIGVPLNYKLFEVAFLVKYADTISVQDLINFGTLDTILTQEEKRFLCTQSYEDFVMLQATVKTKDYQKLWLFKQKCYPHEEQKKLQKLMDYFGDEVWTYFFDKVHAGKDLKNRFRDPHNALLHTDKIIQLAQELEKKGISKADFIKNYLGVAGDRNHGYQQINNFVTSYSFDWHKLLMQELNDPEGLRDPDFLSYAQSLLEQEKMGTLHKNLDSLEQVLPVLNMIRNKESLITLQKLAISKDPKDQLRYNYFKNAIYHPRTRPLIMEMYEAPKKFLGLDDTTFSDLNALHQVKKPSNMVENFPFLDFSAEDLVSCLPLGVYDELSYFKPYEKQYWVNKTAVYTVQEVKNKIADFLLSSDQKRISPIISKYNASFPDSPLSFKAWKENSQCFVEQLLEKSDVMLWIDLFTQLGYQEFNRYKNLRLMTAKISPKADPNNRFNGFNCDSLAEGHGKKVVAMFNPYCTDFCIYDGEQDPKVDNLKVTSRVTLNRAIPHNFNSLLEKAKMSTTYDIAKLFGKDFEDYKDPKEYVITMDNIESDANFGNKHAMTIRKIYEDFFSDYIKQHPLSPNGIPLNTSKFYSGKSYNTIDSFQKTEENKTLPVFVNAYTDNAQNQSLVGELDAGPQSEKVKKTGVQPLSIEDVVQISYLEGKIYPDTMKHYLGNLQHEITASMLNNKLKGRENLSFAWYDDEGKINGYLLAYQGKMSDRRAGIYLSDFAIDEQARGRSGLEMIYHWIQQVKDHYPDMPIFTRAREGTSYRMLTALVERYGYQITEKEKVEDAGEDFYWITMEPTINQ